MLAEGGGFGKCFGFIIVKITWQIVNLSQGSWNYNHTEVAMVVGIWIRSQSSVSARLGELMSLQKVRTCLQVCVITLDSRLATIIL